MKFDEKTYRYNIWISDASEIAVHARILGEPAEELRRAYDEAVAAGQICILKRELTETQIDELREWYHV